MVTKRKNVDDTVRDKVAAVLDDYPDYTGLQLKKEVERRLRGEGLYYNFTERTYQNLKSEIDPTPNDMDKPWSIGACSSYHEFFPPESIPWLLKTKISWDEQQKEVQAQNAIRLKEKNLDPFERSMLERISVVDEFTIRIAIWAVRLSVMAESAELLKYILFIARNYAKAERISEKTKKKVLDTSGLDRITFIDKKPLQAMHPARNRRPSIYNYVLEEEIEEEVENER